jgi:hypothetical protein
MWWKIYFWINILEALLNILSLIAEPGIHIFTQVVLLVLFLVAVVGLYGYIYQKKFLSPVFWQYFLGIYFLIDVVYLIYSVAPQSSILSYLSFLSIYKPDQYSFISALFGVAIDIPLMVALYRLGKNEVHEPNVKNSKKDMLYKWGMLQTALWGYSFILTLLLFVMALFPSGETTHVNKSVEFSALATISLLFIPLVIFWLWIVFTYQKYKWNWWRLTLVANALLFSGSIIFGLFFPSQDKGPAGFDFISAIQLFILFLSLYVFGREQFK